MKPATEILLSAAFVLTPEEKWFGNSVDALDQDRDCAFTALVIAKQVLYPYLSLTDVFAFFRKASGEDGSIMSYNDSHTHAQVLDALYRAAALSELS